VLVFDVDGTLLDTLRPMRQALNEVLVSIGQVPWREQAVREQLSLGLNGLLAAALRGDGVPPGAAAERELQAELLRRYVALAPAQARRYPAADELLKQARAAGCRLAVCSNADGTVLHRLFDHFGWQHLFECVVHAGNALALKPSGLPLQQTLATLGVGPHEAWLVGDSALDARCAQAVGCAFVWFSGGYGGDAPHGLTGRVDALDELVRRLVRPG
jgi:phosphoglycolate phosphatase